MVEESERRLVISKSHSNEQSHLRAVHRGCIAFGGKKIDASASVERQGSSELKHGCSAQNKTLLTQ